MKLNKKQEEIKAKILAGTHVGDLMELSQEQKESLYSYCAPNDDLRGETWKYLGLSDGDFDFWHNEKFNNGLPLINMSEWFEETSEEVWDEAPIGFRTPTDDEIESIRTKDFQGSREYDEKLLNRFTTFCTIDHSSDFDELSEKFLNERYQNEALLKEKAELEARLKEIESKLSNG
jgi:hypothetical protein